jgi:hypothetical protein
MFGVLPYCPQSLLHRRNVHENKNVYDSKTKVKAFAVAVTTMNHKRSNTEMDLNYLEPDVMDIVCGRGWANVYREGNKAFTEIIQSNLHLYLKASSRKEKTAVVVEVLDQIPGSCARFLKEDKKRQRWRRLTREEAHVKIGHAIRDMIRHHGKDFTTYKTKSRTEKFQRAQSTEAKQRHHMKSHKRSRSLADLLDPKTLFDNDEDVGVTHSSNVSTVNLFTDFFQTLQGMYEADPPCVDIYPTNRNDFSGNLRNIFDETPLPAEIIYLHDETIYPIATGSFLNDHTTNHIET